MVRMGNTVSALNSGLAVLGVSLGLAPLLNITVPAIVPQIGWIILGIAGLFFLLGRKRIF